MGWDVWWVWMAGAIVLAILEVLAPGYVFLGFAVGAAVIGVLLLWGGGVAAWLGGSLSMMVLMFAIFSLLAWLVMRKVVGVRKGQTRIWDRDINED
ncbi:MAG: Membrane protein implicated in regulation of membrane protease activity [Rhodobacteraceae bacterium HLUCCO07]|nr:MAG: Membrane protein implicated in regulation of membrane protease activity [Rhodobacteraceae bacterium HLUCCO07]